MQIKSDIKNEITAHQRSVCDSFAFGMGSVGYSYMQGLGYAAALGLSKIPLKPFSYIDPSTMSLGIAASVSTFIAGAGVICSTAAKMKNNQAFNLYPDARDRILTKTGLFATAAFNLFAILAHNYYPPATPAPEVAKPAQIVSGPHIV